MSEIENAEVVREFCEAYNRHDVRAIMTLCADDCVAVYPTLARHPKDVWEKLLAEEVAAFPDGHLTILSLIAQNDKVALEFGWKAIQKGEYRGAAPTNRTFDFPCIFIFELADTRIKLAKLYWNTRLWDLHEKADQVSGETVAVEAR